MKISVRLAVMQPNCYARLCLIYNHKIILMLWFNFILGLNFIFLCFKLIIIHYHTQKQREIKFKPRIKLNHNIEADCDQILLLEQQVCK